MPHCCQLDDFAYNALLTWVDQLPLAEKAAQANDLAGLEKDAWLADSAVVAHSVRCQGAWEVRLLFANPSPPYRLLQKTIARYSCPRRAALTAELMRRQAAKDQRGTIKINPPELDTN
ncbi:MAG: hypothetical protein MUC97_14270 [Bernardetiaceae bacterium]|nr:hypothetical protein [Bernardetiaceae bacterium]